MNNKTEVKTDGQLLRSITDAETHAAVVDGPDAKALRSKHLDLGAVMIALHDAKIHGSVSWFFDGVWHVQLTRDAEDNLASPQEAAEWLRAITIRLYPQSEFAQRSAPSRKRSERGNRRTDLGTIIQALHDSEINGAVSWSHRGGAWHVTLGDPLNGFDAKARSTARKKPPNGCGHMRSSTTQIANLRSNSRIRLN